MGAIASADWGGNGAAKTIDIAEKAANIVARGGGCLVWDTGLGGYKQEATAPG